MTDTERRDDAERPEDAERPDDAAPVPVPPQPPAPPVARRPAVGTARPDEGTHALRLAVLVGLLVVLGVSAGWSYPLIIVGIVVMIFLHELGHFLTAKWSGMKVTEFFIGFGPRIWSFRRGETEYGLKAIPAGAYVRIIGMNNLDEVDPVDEARSYRQQSFPKRLLVVSAGSLMHFAQAAVLLVLALGITGIPGGSFTDPDPDTRFWPVADVSDGSPAAEAGFRDGDEIVAVDGRPVGDFDDGLRSAIRTHDIGDDVPFTVERDGQERTLTATIGGRPDDVEGGPAGSPFLGVTSGVSYREDALGLGTAVVRAPGELLRFSGESLGALAGFFSPDGLGDFANNVGSAREDDGDQGGAQVSAEDDGSENRMLSIFGAVRLGAELSEDGATWVLLFFFQINLFIGILNMVPLPPLDGGHAVVAIYERIRTRRGRRYHADVAKLLPLTYAVVMGLLVLGVTSLYLDIVDPLQTP